MPTRQYAPYAARERVRQPSHLLPSPYTHKAKTAAALSFELAPSTLLILILILKLHPSSATRPQLTSLSSADDDTLHQQSPRHADEDLLTASKKTTQKNIHNPLWCRTPGNADASPDV